MGNGFLKKLERFEAAAKAVKGFDFELAQYDTLDTLEDALDLFFKSLIRDVREIVEVHRVEGAAVSADLFLKNAESFFFQTVTMLGHKIVELAKISERHKSLMSAENKTILHAKMKEFRQNAEREFTKLRKRATEFIQTADTLKINDVRFKRASFTIWSNLTFDLFFTQALKGQFPWEPKDLPQEPR